MLFFLSSYVFVPSVLTTLHGLRVRWNFPRRAARPSLHDSFTYRDPSVSSRRRHLSPLHPYCRYNPRAIQRNLVSSRRLFLTFAGSQLSTPRLSNSVKTLPCFAPFSLSFSLLLRHLSPRLPPRANIIPRNISLPVFIPRLFSASRLSTYIENNSSLVPTLTRLLSRIFARVKFHTMPSGVNSGSSVSKRNNF